MESGATADYQPAHWFNPLQERVFGGPGCHVTRVLCEGDELAGFQVIQTPGHSPGHLAFWRECDGVLILGGRAHQCACVEWAARVV